jgi:hypothetical protein
MINCKFGADLCYERVPFISMRYLSLFELICLPGIINTGCNPLLGSYNPKDGLYLPQPLLGFPPSFPPGNQQHQPPDVHFQAYHRTAPQFHTYIKFPISQISSTVFSITGPNRQKPVYCSNNTHLCSSAASAKSASLPITPQ